jgi:hypothetical protein
MAGRRRDGNCPCPLINDPNDVTPGVVKSLAIVAPAAGDP